ncbi:MAG: hypothetical protein QXM37_04370 [Candidatus Bathyarchaeia archaeon]
MSGRGAEGSGGGFSIRVKAGEYEVEVRGSRGEVLETVKDLPNLITDFAKAFENLRSKPVSVTVKAVTAAVKEEVPVEKYPKIPKIENRSEALLKVLESDWGKWRPRTLQELKEALAANNMRFTDKTLAVDLLNLVKEGKVRRWKTDKGYVYILAEKEILSQKVESL